MRLTAIVCLALNPLLIAPLLDRRRFLVHGGLALACEFIAGLFLWHPEAFESFAAALLCALALPIVIAANFWWLLKVRSNAYYHWRHGTEPHTPAQVNIEITDKRRGAL